MSTVVESLPDAPQHITLASEWIQYVADEPAPTIPEATAEDPWCRASLQFARLCETAATSPDTPIGSPLLFALRKQLKQPLNRHQRQQLAMRTSLQHGLEMFEGRVDDTTASTILSKIHAASVATASEANYALKGLVAKKHSNQHHKNLVIGHRAESVLTGVLTLVGEKDETIVTALPHQKHNGRRSDNYDLLHIEKRPTKTQTVFRTVQLTNSCIGIGNHLPSRDVRSQYHAGTIILSACCDLQPTSANGGSRLIAATYMLKRHLAGQSSRDESRELHDLYDRARDALFDDGGHGGTRGL